MKNNLKFIILFIGFILCTFFFINQRTDIKSLEKDSNDTYFDYESHKSNYTLTTGRITKIMEPMSEHSLEEDPLKWTGGTLPWMCYIEFETKDGNIVNDFPFLFDTKNDSLGNTVEIAYYLRTDIKNGIVATRTEYIPYRKHLFRNVIWIIVFGTASIAVLAFMVIKSRFEEQTF
jgi:hypothetical protein